MKNKNTVNAWRWIHLGINTEATKSINKKLLIGYVVAQLTLAMGVPFNKNTNIKDPDFFKNLWKNTKEMLTSHHVEFQTNKNWPEADIDFFYPGNLVLSKDSDSINQKMDITIPYELAPNFDLAQAIDTNNYAMFDTVIKQKLDSIITQALVSYWFSKDKYKEQNPTESSKLQLSLEKIQGNASPEAKKYGDASLVPWKIEQENIDLAKKHRAEDAKQRILDVFQTIVSQHPEFASQIDTSSLNIIWWEPQLVQEELIALTKLQHQLWFKSIVEMIDANNKGKIKDTKAKKMIDAMITSKRNVVITFTIKWQEKTIFVIPLLLPLLLLIPRIKFRGNWSSIPPLPPLPWEKRHMSYDPKQWKKYMGRRKDKPDAHKQPRDNRQSYFLTSWGTKKRKHNRKWDKN